MREEITYVIGHKNPDTDSICSAIGLSELRAAMGMENVVAARAGDINPQTGFILDYFNIQPPLYLPNVLPRARDIMTRDVSTVTGDTPLLKVMELMRERSIRFVPVVTGQGAFKGVLALLDLARNYIASVEAGGASEVFTTMNAITTTLSADVKLDFIDGEERALTLYVGAMSADSFIDIIGSGERSGLAVIVGDRLKLQLAAVKRGVDLLIISGGFEASKKLLDEASKRGVSVLVSPHDSATTALLVRLSTPARRICCDSFETAAPDEQVEDLKYRLKGSSGMLVLDDGGRIEGVITKSNLLGPSKTNLILVDHNELSQAVDGADKVRIIEVVDHHRIGNFQTELPISFVCEPVGATSTLVSELYRRSGMPIGKKTAGLLLAGVLSDTVMLKSPTTTARDVEIVSWLEEGSGLDHKEFGRKIFSATSSITGRGVKAVVGADHKVFEARGRPLWHRSGGDDRFR